MKTQFISSLLFLGFISGIFVQKIDFSDYLASIGGVQSSTPSVVDKNGNIFVAGGTSDRLNVKSDPFQKSYKGYAKDDVTGGNVFFNEIVTSRRISLLLLYCLRGKETTA